MKSRCGVAPMSPVRRTARTLIDRPPICCPAEACSMAVARSSAPSTTTSIGASAAAGASGQVTNFRKLRTNAALTCRSSNCASAARRREQQRRRSSASRQTCRIRRRRTGESSVTHNRAHAPGRDRADRALRNRRPVARREPRGRIHAGPTAADSFPEVPGAADAPDAMSVLAAAIHSPQAHLHDRHHQRAGAGAGGGGAGGLRHRDLPPGGDPRRRGARRPGRRQQHRRRSAFGDARRGAARRCGRSRSGPTWKRRRSTRRRAIAWPPTPAPASPRRRRSPAPTASSPAAANSRSCAP